MGLNLGMQLGGQASVNGGGMGSVSNPATASEAAFGPGYAVNGRPNSKAALAPNDPFGVAFWTGVGCLALLLLIRHSLPN